MRAFESRWVSVATIPALLAVIVLASLTKLAIRQRRAQTSHASSSATASSGLAVEDEPELLLQEVGAVEAPVDVLDRRELRLLALGQSFGSFPERPAGAFEPAGAARVAGAAGLLPDLAAHLVERAAVASATTW